MKSLVVVLLSLSLLPSSAFAAHCRESHEAPPHDVSIQEILSSGTPECSAAADEYLLLSCVQYQDLSEPGGDVIILITGRNPQGRRVTLKLSQGMACGSVWGGGSACFSTGGCEVEKD